MCGAAQQSEKCQIRQAPERAILGGSHKITSHQSWQLRSGNGVKTISAFQFKTAVADVIRRGNDRLPASAGPLLVGVLRN